MAINSFEDIVAWQQARELTRFVYLALERCRDYGFCDQMRRAAVSVMNNIAEGFELRSENQIRKFFFIAIGSCGEVMSMAILAVDLQMMTKDQGSAIYSRSKSISKMLVSFLRSIDRRSSKKSKIDFSGSSILTPITGNREPGTGNR